MDKKSLEQSESKSAGHLVLQPVPKVLRCLVMQCKLQRHGPFAAHVASLDLAPLPEAFHGRCPVCGLSYFLESPLESPLQLHALLQLHTLSEISRGASDPAIHTLAFF